MTNNDFQALAAHCFDFLRRDLGFKLKNVSGECIRYESSTVYVDVVFDKGRSFELSVLLGKLPVEDFVHPFSIAEILRLRGYPEAKRFSLLQVTATSMLKDFLAELAKTLQENAIDLLSGSEKGFTDLSLQREKEVTSYALNRDLTVARQEAEKAWRQKDYGSVVKFLQPFKGSLEPAENEKLRYAEDRLKHR